MKKIIFLVLLLSLCAGLLFAAGEKEGAAFPQKPIKLIVYTKPGGLIDTTAQKLLMLVPI